VSPSIGHILVVDDDEAFCYAIAKALRNAGFVVSGAPDHHLALRILEGPQPPDLLITDLVMPGGINGFALARMGRMRRLDLRVGIGILAAVIIPPRDLDEMAESCTCPFCFLLSCDSPSSWHDHWRSLRHINVPDLRWRLGEGLSRLQPIPIVLFSERA
jgi:CheY-like chemotaxis protein